MQAISIKHLIGQSRLTYLCKKENKKRMHFNFVMISVNIIY